MKKGISAVLITKNAEANLKRCIDSLGGVEQVVVHDTGSTDGTVDLARSLGAEVIANYGEKPFHFANARNRALQEAKYEWTLSIDADEVLREGSLGALRDGIKNINVAGYDVLHVNRPFEGGTELPSTKLRFFKTNEFVWMHRIHEIPLPKGTHAKVGVLKGCVIDHFPAAEKGERREQNLELLLLCVKETPDYMQAWKQLGIEYQIREDWEKAIEPLETYAKGSNWHQPLEEAELNMRLGQCYFRTGNPEKACDFFYGAHQAAPERREPLFFGALEMIQAKDPRSRNLWMAAEWLEEALKIRPSPMPEFSLYSREVQGTLVQDTLIECKSLISQVEADLKAQQGQR